MGSQPIYKPAEDVFLRMPSSPAMARGREGKGLATAPTRSKDRRTLLAIVCTTAILLATVGAPASAAKRVSSSEVSAAARVARRSASAAATSSSHRAAGSAAHHHGRGSPDAVKASSLGSALHELGKSGVSVASGHAGERGAGDRSGAEESMEAHHNGAVLGDGHLVDDTKQARFASAGAEGGSKMNTLGAASNKLFVAQTEARLLTQKEAADALLLRKARREANAPRFQAAQDKLYIAQTDARLREGAAAEVGTAKRLIHAHRASSAASAAAGRPQVSLANHVGTHLHDAIARHAHAKHARGSSPAAYRDAGSSLLEMEATELHGLAAAVAAVRVRGDDDDADGPPAMPPADPDETSGPTVSTGATEAGDEGGATGGAGATDPSKLELQLAKEKAAAEAPALAFIPASDDRMTQSMFVANTERLLVYWQGRIAELQGDKPAMTMDIQTVIGGEINELMTSEKTTASQLQLIKEDAKGDLWRPLAIGIDAAAKATNSSLDKVTARMEKSDMAKDFTERKKITKDEEDALDEKDKKQDERNEKVDEEAEKSLASRVAASKAATAKRVEGATRVRQEEETKDGMVEKRMVAQSLRRAEEAKKEKAKANAEGAKKKAAEEAVKEKAHAARAAMLGEETAKHKARIAKQEAAEKKVAEASAKVRVHGGRYGVMCIQRKHMIIT